MALPVRNGSAPVRRRLLSAAAAFAAFGTACLARAEERSLRFGTTPVFLDEQIGMLSEWQRYLTQRLTRPVRFVQRGSYREIVDLLLNDGIDAAWLCGYPFVLYESRLSLLAVPSFRGAPLYRSYLVVPERDTETRSILDLQGRVFAYSDPLSNSGFLVPRTELLREGRDATSFFRRTFFTFGHRKVIDAVQAGLAQGGAVDGYVWDTLALQQPLVTTGVRVAWRSETFGFPPIVARASLASADAGQLAEALLRMGTDPQAVDLLRRLNLDGFTLSDQRLFSGIRTMARNLDLRLAT